MTRRGEKTSVAYGGEHQRLRVDLAPIVATGKVRCWRCGRKIRPGEPWDLGHDDSRNVIMGPEHRHARPGCPGNRAAGWRKIIKRPPDNVRRPYGGDPGWG